MLKLFTKMLKTIFLGPLVLFLNAGSLGCGATLKFGTTNTVSEITNVAGPGYEADDVDVTTHNNTTRFRNFVKGLTDAGAFDIDGYVTSAEATIIDTIANTTTIYSVTITMPTAPSASKFEANCYVKSYKLEDPVDDVIKYALSLKIDGKPTFSKV